MDKKSFLQKFKDKKILILGLGREGTDNFLFIRKIFSQAVVGLANKADLKKLDPVISNIIENDKKIILHIGKNYLKSLKDYDLIIKSPGIPIHFPEIEEAENLGKIITQTKIFFDYCPGTIIGVTGTKGKSTTSSLIYAILKKGGRRVKLLGNIGIPVLSALMRAKKEDFFVLELSSHQLYNLKKSPHVAVLLNIYPEHLDYYKNYKEYIRAKTNIAIHQKKNDYFIYNSINKEAREIAKKTPATRIAYDRINFKFPKKNFPLIGKFNFFNAKAAAVVGKIFRIPNNKIKDAITHFKPLPHRLELTGIYNGIRFYNDSLSTIQESTVAAIEGLGRDIETLIAGGFDRNQRFEKLAGKILSSGIATLILFPTTGRRIWKDVERKANKKKYARRFNKISCYFAKNMEEAVNFALRKTKKGKICLMSCASSSFSIFRDYEEKGRQYKHFLKKLSKRDKKEARKVKKT